MKKKLQVEFPKETSMEFQKKTLKKSQAAFLKDSLQKSVMLSQKEFLKQSC